MTQSVLSGDLPDRCHSQPQSILSPLFGRRISTGCGAEAISFHVYFFAKCHTIAIVL